MRELELLEWLLGCGQATWKEPNKEQANARFKRLNSEWFQGYADGAYSVRREAAIKTKLGIESVQRECLVPVEIELPSRFAQAKHWIKTVVSSEVALMIHQGFNDNDFDRGRLDAYLDSLN